MAVTVGHAPWQFRRLRDERLVFLAPEDDDLVLIHPVHLPVYALRSPAGLVLLGTVWPWKHCTMQRVFVPTNPSFKRTGCYVRSDPPSSCRKTGRQKGRMSTRALTSAVTSRRIKHRRGGLRHKGIAGTGFAFSVERGDVHQLLDCKKTKGETTWHAR